MTLSMADVEQWDPTKIDEVSDALVERARHSGTAADDIGEAHTGADWHGEAGDAAKQAGDKTAAGLDGDAQNDVLTAMAARKSAGDVRGVKNQQKSILEDAAAAGVSVNLETNTITLPDTTGWDDDEVAALRDKIADLEDRMVAMLAAATEADSDLARVMTAAAGGEIRTPAEQGSGDGKSLQDGRLTPEESARLQANTTLTPQQLDALARGELVLPASQMEYLNQVARSLDGKSTPEIRALMNRLGADGDRLQDALQLVSNENITTVGAGGLKGSFDKLPEAIRRDLTKYPLDHHDSPVGAYTSARPEMLDLAAMAERGNPALQQGTSFDHAMLKQAEMMLDNSKIPDELAKNNHGQELVPFNKGQVDPALQAMLSAAGRDQMALHDALGANANGDPGNEKMIENLLTRQWADDGAAASGMLTGLAPVAEATNLADPTQVAQATRAGEIMHAVDQWAGEKAPKLLDIAGTDGQSLGQVNPELARGLAEANRPYIDDMLGNKLDNTLGFEPLDDLKKPELPVTRDLFSVIDTDRQAAETLNAKAYLNGIQYEDNFEKSIVAGESPDVGDLHSAGTMRGVIETAANLADNDAIKYGNLQDVRAYESRGEWLDAAKKLGGQIPVFKELLDSIGKMPGDPLKEIFVGNLPTPDPTTGIVTTTSESLQYSVASELLNNGIGDNNAFSRLGLLDEFGRLKALDNDTIPNFRTAFLDYFAGIDPKVALSMLQYQAAYSQAHPTAQSHTGK